MTYLVQSWKIKKKENVINFKNFIQTLTKAASRITQTRLPENFATTLQNLWQ